MENQNQKKKKTKKKKSNSLKLFNKLAKRAYKLSKKRKLDWKWSDAQKWTSKNIFQKYKGTKSISKIRLTDIDNDIVSILDVGVVTIPTPPKSREICFSPFDVASTYLDDFEWFNIDDNISILNNNLKVDLDLEYSGQVFAQTGVIKQGLLPNLITIREEIRKVAPNSPVLEMKCAIVLIDGKPDDRNIPCNYYVLIAFKDSPLFGDLEARGLIKKQFVTQEQMPIDEKTRLEAIEKQKEEDRKRLRKKDAKNAPRPHLVEPKKVEPLVEPKVEPKAEPKAKKMSADELKTIRWQQFNIAKASYRKDYDDGLIDKAEYKAIILKLESKLEKGGKI
jgi:hypothetical protein